VKDEGQHDGVKCDRTPSHISEKKYRRFVTVYKYKCSKLFRINLKF